MRTLFLLGLGVLFGAVATVLFFTLDTSFEADGSSPPVAVGNARLSLDEDALSLLVASELRELSEYADIANMNSDIRPDGLITFTFSVGTLGVGLKSSITVDPEVVAGRLELNVVDASLGELSLPDRVATAIEEPLQERIDTLAGRLDYRLTAITTADDRLTFEIQI